MGQRSKAATKRLTPDQAMIEGYIMTIAESPFGQSEGKEIVKKLRALNSQNKIAFDPREQERGAWDGNMITVKHEYRESVCKATATLVHEASHALWPSNSKIRKGTPEWIEDLIKEELKAQTNEVMLYAWLKEDRHLCSSDVDLDVRLERLRRGTLESVIRQTFNAGEAEKRH